MLPLNSELTLPFPARITQFDFQAADGDQLASITLSLIPAENSGWRIKLRFTGVRDISIPAFPVEGIRCALFEVSELSDAAWHSPKWQDVNWMVGDLKTDTLVFYAKTAGVISIEKI